MVLRPPRSTRTDTLVPYTSLCRSLGGLFRQRRGLVVAAVLYLGLRRPIARHGRFGALVVGRQRAAGQQRCQACRQRGSFVHQGCHSLPSWPGAVVGPLRSEEHTSELQSLMRISYAVFCLKKKQKK